MLIDKDVLKRKLYEEAFERNPQRNKLGGYVIDYKAVERIINEMSVVYTNHKDANLNGMTKGGDAVQEWGIPAERQRHRPLFGGQ